MIHRQTGQTTYELIKDIKSTWKAFWSSTAASTFNLNLKAKYEPFKVNEDYLIEAILDKFFKSGRLPNQPPANPVDIEELDDYWLALKANSK